MEITLILGIIMLAFIGSAITSFLIKAKPTDILKTGSGAALFTFVISVFDVYPIILLFIALGAGVVLELVYDENLKDSKE